MAFRGFSRPGVEDPVQGVKSGYTRGMDGSLSLRRTLELYFSYFALLTPGARIVWFTFDLVSYSLLAAITLLRGARKAQEALIALGMGRALCLLRLPDGNKVLFR